MKKEKRKIKKVIILGAAGRDYHNFNVFFRNNSNYRVVAFTAAQIPYLIGKKYPKELAGKFYPKGIPIYDEKDLPKLIRKHDVDIVVLAYSDLFHEEVMHKASLVLSHSTDFWLLGPKSTQIKSNRPVISVTATRTGAGKSTVTRKIANILRNFGVKLVIIRHPMPYQRDLRKQISQKFKSYDALEKCKCTIEEKEEYEQYLDEGFIVYAGVDYEKVLRKAEKEAEIIVFEGGNNDIPLIKPDLHITVADPHRPGHEISSYPGETNAISADILIINKINTAKKEDVKKVENNLKKINKKKEKAIIVKAESVINVDHPELIKGKKVIVVEDGPTVTHGGLKHAAGYLAAKKFGARIISPGKFAVGSIKKAIVDYGLEVVPALGYNKKQMKELETTLNKAKSDSILLGTPSNLGRYMKLNKPIARVNFELKEKRNVLRSKLKSFLIEMAK